MKIDDFYVLGINFAETTAIALEPDMSRLPKERRPNAASLNPKVVDEIMDYEWPLVKPVPCRILEGKKWTDYVNNTFGLLFCLKGLLDVLNETTKTTWQTTPIQLLLSKGVRMPPTPVSWLRLPVGCGELHATGAFIPFEEKYRLKYEDRPFGVSFDVNTWNGEDLFRPPKPSLFFVTPKLATALRKAPLTGLVLTPFAEYGKPI